MFPDDQFEIRVKGWVTSTSYWKNKITKIIILILGLDGHLYRIYNTPEFILVLNTTLTLVWGCIKLTPCLLIATRSNSG